MPAPQTEVLITVDGKEHARHVLAPGDYVIGRNSDCPIRVEADLVSRQHAKLILNYDHALIEDLGSSNGTQVNGQPIPKDESTRLWPNQKIQVGTATIELRRLKAEVSDMSLAPAQAMVRRVLPEEFLREKRYDIGKVVARGGMGAILDAREATTERTVAMKVMLDTNDAGDIARFLNEAKVTAQLEHPNIVPVHELSVDENGQPYYTMKMVKGITLKKVLELLADRVEATVKKFPLAALLTIFQKVCDAIAFAHSKGVIHRDLKPENIMLGDYGEALVMDWGLAKKVMDGACHAAHPSPAAAGGHAASSFDLHPPSLGTTLAGTVMGTPQFMSPEQARGEVDSLDARSDIYSLGAILYQILSLHVSVTGTDVWEVVGKVGRGEIEPLQVLVPRRKDAQKDKGGNGNESQSPSFASWRLGASHLPGGRIPESLAAVVKKAMALAPSARYATVAELQRDIEAYQGGFATGAEKAGAWKLFTLFVKRNKAASIGVAAALLIGGIFGTKAIVEGRRAERALTELKASAPALLQLAESEADSQRFDSALAKADAALALDPSLLRAEWRRAWILIAQEKFTEAADALRLAQRRDPGNARQAAILPQIERMAAAKSDADRFATELITPVFDHLLAIGASGESAAVARRIKLGAEQRMIIVRQRLDTLQKSGRVRIETVPPGLIQVASLAGSMSNLEILRGLPFDILNAKNCGLTTLEPLRGLHLSKLDLIGNAITDLSPLQGMSLVELIIPSNPVADLSPLKGMPLRVVTLPKDVSDLSPLRGVPLESVSAPNVSDLSPLEDAPLRYVNFEGAKVTDITPLRAAPLRSVNLTRCFGLRDLSPLRGKPLEVLRVGNTAVADLTPLQGAPLKELDVGLCKKITDYTPILTLPLLERLVIHVLPKELLPLRESKTLQTIQGDAYTDEGSQGARPVAEFWRAYDAWKAKQPK